MIAIMVVKGGGEEILNIRAEIREQAGRYYVAVTINSDGNGRYAFTLHYFFMRGGEVSIIAGLVTKVSKIPIY